ncbi:MULTISPECIES: transcriptional regulator [Micrococcaceae]|uniref:winged helix-turn-helix domain-containing protein n=1 Tax=Micrococcaceae TaxID=1268 RepID=UPI000CFC3CE7|nr:MULTISPECIES: transcriptional regulator [unclassified Arthrobacter]MCS3493324.1 DNA-binding MarR family transcriptional regulator [Arthrobacter sp. JUb119]PQZ86747.1 ArsR family transcriptional regulator [Arthrobacter sp. MYb222]PRB73607.1 ArsR family transcriptional regulator [Arthrobacter sp. MYb214]TDU20326.1 transcriptional regulator [Arthrobacter sp. JUb115]
MNAHARERLNDDFSNPVRLSLMGSLQAVDEADFKSLKEAIGISDSVLSRHLSALEAGGYVQIKKGYVGKRPRTWAKLTSAGQEAFAQHVQALKEITGLG